MHTKVLLRLVAVLQTFLLVNERSNMPLPQGLCTCYSSFSQILILLFKQISSQMTPCRGLLCHLPVYKTAPFLTFILLTLLYFSSQHCYHLAWYLFICLWLSSLEFRLHEGNNFVFFSALLYRLNTQKSSLEQIRHSKKFDTFMCLSAKSLFFSIECQILSAKCRRYK